MPVDYSKWDALELSDDSDFEPHPNVDKRSFIRAKQAQIHQQRAERKHRITTLKYERLVNDGLLRRIDTLLAELKSHEVQAKELSASTSEDTGKNRDAFIYQVLIASAGDPDDDEAPKPPEGVHSKEQEPIRYSQMMGALVDQVKKEVDEAKPDDWYKGYVKGLEGHKKKVAGLQSSLAQELAKLEKEESRKITSESIHDGFNTSHVAKEVPTPAAATASKGKVRGPSKPTETVEVLNPSALQNRPDLTDDAAQSSGADADIDEDVESLEDKDEQVAEASELGKQFAKIPIGDYQTCLKFISQNRTVLAEEETDGLLMLAFDAQTKGKAGFAKQCVHQALLLQYCRALGPSGVQLFFKRYVTISLVLCPLTPHQHHDADAPSPPALPRRRRHHLQAHPDAQRRVRRRARRRRGRRRRADPAAGRRARQRDLHQRPQGRLGGPGRAAGTPSLASPPARFPTQRTN